MRARAATIVAISGWIGTFGLAGLLGSRRETHDLSRNPSTTTAPVR